MTHKLQLIVEGDGDMKAVPVLVRRILEQHEIYDVVPSSDVHKRGDIPKVKGRFSDYFQAAILENNPVLCVLDFDCEKCNDVEAEETDFQNLAATIRPGYPFAACFIVKEFESLFLWDELTVKKVLPNRRLKYAFPVDPETVRGAKEELSRGQASGWSYKPTVHQAKLAAQVDLNLLKKSSPSYRRLEAAVLSMAKTFSTT